LTFQYLSGRPKKAERAQAPANDLLQRRRIQTNVIPKEIKYEVAAAVLTISAVTITQWYGRSRESRWPALFITPLLHGRYRNRLNAIQALGVSMRKLIRPFAAAVYISCLAVSGILVSIDGAMAEDQVASPAKQIVLTKKQIEGVLGAQKEMDEINEKLSEKARPYLIVAEQLEGVAKKNGFASYDEYTEVVDNISIVLAGLDPVTRKYVGSEAVIRAQIARVKADKNVPAENKTEALAELDNALKSPAPSVENKGNIDLVATYYDRLAEAMGSDRQ
jgi:hypothetical protein